MYFFTKKLSTVGIIGY